MLGPVSPSPIRLKSWVGTHQALLDHQPPPRVPKRIAGQVVVHRVACLGQIVGDHYALTRCQAVCFDDERRRHRVEEGPCGLGLGEGSVGGGGHAGLGQQVFHVRLGALQLRAVGTGAKHEASIGAQPVGQAVHQWRLRADHIQIGVDILGRDVDRPFNQRVARGDEHLGGIPSQHVGQRSFASARSDHTDSHRPIMPHALKPARTGVAPRPVPHCLTTRLEQPG